MKKYIKDSRGYFDFINKYKEKIEVKEVRILKKSIRVDYEVIKNES